MTATMTTVSEQILKEGNLFLYSLLLGAVLTFAYDLLRIMRRLFPRGKWSVAFEDLIFWLASALCVFLLLYRKNDGSLRSFALVGLVLGMLAYGKLLSRYVVKASVFLLGKFLCALFWPFVKISQALRPPLKRIRHFFKRGLLKVAKNVRIIMCKNRLFFNRFVRQRSKAKRKQKHGSEKRVSKD